MTLVNTSNVSATLILDLRSGEFKNGVECLDNDMFRSQSPSHYEISEENIPNYLTFHYIKDRDTQIRYSNLCSKWKKNITYTTT